MKQRWVLGCWGVSVALLLVVAAAGNSVAVVGLGPLGRLPPWDVSGTGPDLSVHVPAALLVTVTLWLAYVIGAVGVWLGWRAVAAGWRPDARRALLASALIAVAMTLVPPVGSADHLSYLAYGRITAAGADSYSIDPSTWRGGVDPVVSAIQPPWEHTPNVYGPIATGVFSVAAWWGNGELRASVWFWQLICAVAWMLTAWLLVQMTPPHSRVATTASEKPGEWGGSAPYNAARSYALVTWALNPLLLGQLVLGAHLDVVAVAPATLGIMLAMRRHRWLAGMALGAAISIKVPYGITAVAVSVGYLYYFASGQSRLTSKRCSGQTKNVRPLLRCWLIQVAQLTLGAVAVIVPAHLLAGPHVFAQLSTASGFTTLASPWRMLVNLIEKGTGQHTMRHLVVPVALLVTFALAWQLWVALQRTADDSTGPVNTSEVNAGKAIPVRLSLGIVAALIALGMAWVLCAPYSLPWYVPLAWMPLTLLGLLASSAATSAQQHLHQRLRLVLVVQLAVLSLAYVPGRVVGLPSWLELVTVTIVRTYVAPVVVLGCVVVTVRAARQAIRIAAP